MEVLDEDVLKTDDNIPVYDDDGNFSQTVSFKASSPAFISTSRFNLDVDPRSAVPRCHFVSVQKQAEFYCADCRVSAR